MVDQDIEKRKYLEHLLENLPHNPGVYRMKDEGGRVIYVGKAKDLKKRVTSYFRNEHIHGMRTKKMVENISDIAYTEVGTELEALILETNLIKELRPKYNVLMKDDKSYVYIKITIHDDYPQIYLVRKVVKDKARYFGPKTAAHKVIKTLKLLKRIFPFKNCPLAIDYNVRNEFKAKIMSPAQFEYHRRHCLGPCITSVTPEEYKKTVLQVIDFLEGKYEDIVIQVKQDMMKAASEKKFEVAAAIRDKLKALEDIMESQRISDPHQKDLDIVSYVVVEDKIYFNLFQLREGKLIDQENFIFKSTGDQETEDRDALNSFLEQYYERATDIPKEVLIPHEVDEQETIESWLTEIKGQKVHLIIPERGKKNHLLELSLSNAQSFARQSQIKWQGHEKTSRQEALEALQEILGLPKVPYRLECYDNSHFGGTETVSSMVVFENGFPKKDDYRHFKLHQQTSGSPDDYASMEETLTRRLKYLKPNKFLPAISVKKAAKKHFVTITEKFTKEETAQGDWYTIDEEKNIKGYLQVTIFDPEKNIKKFLINTLEIDPSVDLAVVIKKMIEKIKAARIYLKCLQSDQSKFEEVGFQHLQKIPEAFPKLTNQTYLVFDKTKHVTDKSFRKTPDLIVIDGGKGQLSSAQKAMKKYELSIPMISLAKREEEIFRPDRPDPLLLEANDPILHMLQHIRDESHRFAITYHQKLRLKATTSSVLDTIPGIGESTRIKLLQKFGSVEGIKNATLDELAAEVGKKNAIVLKQKF